VAILENGGRRGEGYQEISKIYKESKVPKGTAIAGVERLSRTKEIMESPSSRYRHRRICLAKRGTACSYHSF
jgi:hypothetical protein